MDIRHKINTIYSLEQLSCGDSAIHRLHPMCKLLAAFVFILTVVSFDRYAFGRLIPFVFYPVILTSLSETPGLLILKRVFLVLPFCFFIGVFGLFFETRAAFFIGNIPVSLGLIAFAVLLFRAFLCVAALLILVAVTSFSDLTAQMRLLKVPYVFVVVFEMTYRYIGVLFDEAVSMYTAYVLRASRKKGVDMRDAGSFVGHLLLRSFDRAERVYAAMLCRGYNLRGTRKSEKPCLCDVVYCATVFIFCAVFRFFDVAALFPSIAGRFFNA